MVLLPIFSYFEVIEVDKIEGTFLKWDVIFKGFPRKHVFMISRNRSYGGVCVYVCYGIWSARYITVLLQSTLPSFFKSLMLGFQPIFDGWIPTYRLSGVLITLKIFLHSGVS